jgi:hypothetical protein
MRKVQQLGVCNPDDLAGAFIETAFSADQVDRALLEERQAGVQENECSFLFPVKASPASQV